MRSQVLVATVAAMMSASAFAQKVPPHPKVQERFFEEGRLSDSDPDGLEAKFQMLQRPDVMVELSLDADQKTQLKAVLQERQEQRKARRPPAGPLPRFNQLTPEQLEQLKEDAETRHKQEAETRAKAFDVLYAEQRGRLEQLSLQQQGPEALLRPAISESLKLTPEQIKKLEELRETMRTPPDNAGPPRNQEEMAKRREAYLQRRKTFDSAAPKVLTPEQAAQWAEMQGPTFDFQKSTDRK